MGRITTAPFCYFLVNRRLQSDTFHKTTDKHPSIFTGNVATNHHKSQHASIYNSQLAHPTFHPPVIVAK
jgi:hypothetical protein